MGLLTPQLVAIKAELGSKFPLCSLSELDQTELWEFRSCLGIDLYDAMLSNKVDYSTTPDWQQGTYTAGSLVKYKGIVWVALSDTSYEPIYESIYWGLAPIFDISTVCGELYEQLFCDYLARYLSLKIALLTIGRMAVSITSGGVIRLTGNGMIPADVSEIKILQSTIETQTIQTFDNMKYWIRKKIEDGYSDCFPNYNSCGVVEKKCEPVSCCDEACVSSKPFTVGISVY